MTTIITILISLCIIAILYWLAIGKATSEGEEDDSDYEDEIDLQAKKTMAREDEYKAREDEYETRKNKYEKRIAEYLDK